MGKKVPKGVGRLLTNQLDKDQPIPEFDNTSTVDYCKQAANFTDLFDWRNDRAVDSKKFLEEQCNFEKALEVFNKELNVPNQQELNKSLKTIRTPAIRNTYADFFKKKVDCAKLEASIYHAAGVTALT